MQQVDRFAIGVGPYVRDEAQALSRGKDGGQGRALDAFDAAQSEEGRCQRAARVASGGEGVGLPVLHQVHAHYHRGVLLLPDGHGRFVGHLDDLAGMNDGQRQPSRVVLG